MLTQSLMLLLYLRLTQRVCTLEGVRDKHIFFGPFSLVPLVAGLKTDVMSSKLTSIHTYIITIHALRDSLDQALCALCASSHSRVL